VNDHADGHIRHQHGRSGYSVPWTPYDKVFNAMAWFEWAAMREGADPDGEPAAEADGE
jgi:hypothetical protein